MQFANVAGQNNIKERLLAMFRENRIGHALLFSEDEGFGALPLAIAFAQYINCKFRTSQDSCGTCPTCNKFNKLIHPDLHFAMPVNSTKATSLEKKGVSELTSAIADKNRKSTPADKRPVSDMFLSAWREMLLHNPYFTEQEWYKKIEIENKTGNIGVAEASLIVKKLSMMSFEGGAKFMIVWLPERMNLDAANRLLKLIEEPPKETYIFMVSEAPEKIIPTILSRCQMLRLHPIEKEVMFHELISEFDLEDKEAQFWAKISGGSLTKVREMINDSDESTQLDKSLALLLEGCVTKELQKVISFWEDISLTGRENQKLFLEYTLEFLRRSLMISVGVNEVANIPPNRIDFVTFWAGKFKPAFYNRAYILINRAIEDINRNVNSKYLFADLSNRFFLSL
ncbi:MAG: hypothetical protein WCR71_05150 [Bacteroidales bacterium]